MAAVLVAGALVCGWTPPAWAEPNITVVALPADTTVGELAGAGLSPGVMSAGIGSVPPLQTYLDISQGNRVASPLYDLPLTSGWDEIVARAQTAPADLVPGLLASTMVERGVPVRADPSLRAAAAITTDRDGLTRRGSTGPGLSLVPATLGSLPARTHGLRGNDLLIAFAQPTGDARTVPIGIAGSGFQGDLTSDSTRTGGYVLSTDVAPTILRRFGLPVPDEMDGEPIRAEGSVDPGAVEDRADRMAAIPGRRAPVLIACLAAWILIALAVNRIVFGLRRVAIAWLALCFAYLPLLLLVGAALEPSAVAEGLVLGLGAAALAALTVRFAWGWRGFALACAVTVAAYAIDVTGGSEFTKLSLLGPNPIYGARFYGIGNELEALLVVMVPAGVGAGLTAAGPGGRISPRAAAGAFLAAGVVGALVFGVGRFGADVGAAIVLPVGGAAAALALPAKPRSWPRIAAALTAIPFIALLLLALIDLASGANAHLTRSVLDAGGGGLADAAQRRLELNAHDFGRAASEPLFWVVIAAVILAISQRRRIDPILLPAPAVRAALIGACAAVGVGTLANDSGAAYLVLGSLALAALLVFAWAQAPAGRKSRKDLEIRVMRESAAGKY